jgi:predicted ester cyclase
MHEQIPELHVTIEDMIAEGDKVVCRNAWRGTTKSGRPVEFKGIVIWRLADGKIVERWATVALPSS